MGNLEAFGNAHVFGQHAVFDGIVNRQASLREGRQGGGSEEGGFNEKFDVS